MQASADECWTIMFDDEYCWRRMIDGCLWLVTVGNQETLRNDECEIPTIISYKPPRYLELGNRKSLFMNRARHIVVSLPQRLPLVDPTIGLWFNHGFTTCFTTANKPFSVFFSPFSPHHHAWWKLASPWSPTTWWHCGSMDLSPWWDAIQVNWSMV